MTRYDIALGRKPVVIQTPKDQVAIHTIMEEFDFETVAMYMVKYNWTWYGMGVPSREKIKKEALRLIQGSFGEHKHVTTGGFTVENTGLILKLSFKDGPKHLIAESVVNL